MFRGIHRSPFFSEPCGWGFGPGDAPLFDMGQFRFRSCQGGATTAATVSWGPSRIPVVAVPERWSWEIQVNFIEVYRFFMGIIGRFSRIMVSYHPYFFGL